MRSPPRKTSRRRSSPTCASSSTAATHASACSATPTSSPSFRNWRARMNEPPKRTSASKNQELIRAVWDEARDLVKRLEGSTVQRFSVEAGDTKIEIERRAGVVVADAGTSGGTVTTTTTTTDGAGEPAAEGHPIKA